MNQLLPVFEEYVGEKGGNCVRCPRLVEHRDSIVFGEGDPDADLLIVGEKPGGTEDDLGRPFVGGAGAFLDDVLSYFARKDDEWLYKLGGRISRGYSPTDSESDQIREHLIEGEKVFYTNALLCQPPENAEPTKTELINCQDRLMRTIYAIDPLLILAVGKVPVKAILGKQIKITHDRGQVFDVEVPGVTGNVRYPMLVAFHPAYVTRSQDFTSKTGPGQKFANDIQKAFRLLDLARVTTRGEKAPSRRRWK